MDGESRARFMAPELRSAGTVLRELLQRALSACLPSLDPPRPSTAALRAVAREVAEQRLEPIERVRRLATVMYEQALRAGSGQADVGLYGPRLFYREAAEFLGREGVIDAAFAASIR